MIPSPVRCIVIKIYAIKLAGVLSLRSLLKMNPHKQIKPQPYIGRFAPSPSGPLHLGSLVCALASFLHAKQHNGKWLVRIEDIDTPRSDATMVPVILSTLVAHGLHWDDEIVYQSQRHAVYERYLTKLDQCKCLYACACTRQQIKARGPRYDGYCKNLSLAYANNATRFKQCSTRTKFTDIHLGDQHIVHASAFEDPVLKRADGIYAYNLAVVVDDIEQNINHIVRGNDLLTTTPIQLGLYEALKEPAPHYLHIPVVAQRLPTNTSPTAHRPSLAKLSKQNHAPALNNAQALNNLCLALRCLGISFDKHEEFANVEECLTWATVHWTSNLLSKQSEVLISVTNDVYSTTSQTFNEQ
jgi:glutamyl-Q tRNA(Asp) synthetase